MSTCEAALHRMALRVKARLASLFVLVLLGASGSIVLARTGGQDTQARREPDHRQEDSALARTLEEARQAPIRSGGVAAAYLDHWVSTVEASGGGGLLLCTDGDVRSGDVIVSVSIERDGGVSGTQVVRSSGDEAVDEAVVAAIRSAAPFAPLPAGFRDALYVTRTWRALPRLRARSRE